MIYVLALVASMLLVGGAVKAKNTVEDVVTASSDSFTRWDSLFQNYGGGNWKILKAICMNESSLGEHPSVALGIQNPSDVEDSASEDGKSWGLMQVTVTTGRDFDAACSPQLLNNPDYSVRIAARLLASLRSQFNELEYVVKAYNQGAGNTRKEMSGAIDGYAQEYWERFTRNAKIIETKQGGFPWT